MASDVEFRKLTRVVEKIDKKLGDLVRGLVLLNQNLQTLAEIAKRKEGDDTNA